ncbi:MAG: hypothetical protein ACI9XO_001859 [Paraglaciecola sp.]
MGSAHLIPFTLRQNRRGGLNPLRREDLQEFLLHGNNVLAQIEHIKSKDKAIANIVQSGKEFF